MRGLVSPCKPSAEPVPLPRWPAPPRFSFRMLLSSMKTCPSQAFQCVLRPRRIGSIYQPAFVAGGDAVAASCERSPLLSLYCTKTGATISRGSIDVAVGATACGSESDAPLLCTAARSVLLYQPTWEAA